MRRLGSLAFAATIAVGCRANDTPPPPLELPSSAPPRPLAVDELRPGELAEGSENAFGFPVPRRMTVGARFSDAVFAEGTPSPERVANYVRERVVAAHVETGPAKTVFTGATMKAAPDRIVRIEVVDNGNSTELIVRDETRPPAKDGLTEEERWKELGLDTKGRPLDPTHLE